MLLRLLVQISGCLTLLFTSTVADDPGNTHAPTSRSFAIGYEFEVQDLQPNAELKVWCPVPSSNDHQRISITESSGWKIGREPKYGNQVAYAVRTTSTESQKFELRYDIIREEVRTGQTKSNIASPHPKDHSVWLKANTLVPLTGTHLRLLSELKPATNKFEQSQQLYDLVLNHVDYRKDQPGWGRGDAVWVCDSQFGNCTDFHSLFISLSRVRNVPAKFEIGFSIPTDGAEGDLKGYHCWAWFHDDQRGWVPVDISEADKHPEQAKYFFGNLTADRVAMSTGRDIVLQPPQTGAPLNYFIAPYAEVNGKPVPSSQIKMSHTWKVIAQK